MSAVVQLPLDSIIMGLGPGTPPYQEMKCLHSPCPAIQVLWDYPSLSLAHWIHFVSAWSLCIMVPDMVPSQRYCCICFPGGDRIFLLVHKMGAHRQNILCGLQGEIPSYERPIPTIEANLVLSFLYLKEALFHLLFHCVIFSLVALIPGCSGQKCIDSSGIGDWCWYSA